MVIMVNFFDEDYYRVSELTKKFKVSKYAVYKWINDGKLQAIRVGGSIRVLKSSFDTFIYPIRPGEIDTEIEQPDEE
jgi:excisionase family DNA binding protein